MFCCRHAHFHMETFLRGTNQNEMDKTSPKQFLFKVKYVLCRVHHTLMKNVRLRNVSEFSFVSKIMLFPFNQKDVKQVELCKLSLETFSLHTTQRWITTTADLSSCKNCFARLELELQGLYFFPLVVWGITEQNISLLHFLCPPPCFFWIKPILPKIAPQFTAVADVLKRSVSKNL